MELYPVGFFFFQNWNLSQMLNSEQTEKQQEDKKNKAEFQSHRSQQEAKINSLNDVSLSTVPRGRFENRFILHPCLPQPWCPLLASALTLLIL